MTVSREIASMVPVRDIVRQAIMDTYGDFVNEEQRFTAWTIRGVKKLVRQTLRSGKRYVILNVNKNLRTAILPCDFEEELAVFVVNKCGERVDLNINPYIVNHEDFEDIPCENECGKKCGCYPKQIK